MNVQRREKEFLELHHLHQKGLKHSVKKGLDRAITYELILEVDLNNLHLYFEDELEKVKS